MVAQAEGNGFELAAPFPSLSPSPSLPPSVAMCPTPNTFALRWDAVTTSDVIRPKRIIGGLNLSLRVRNSLFE